jgi:hypothetical protein
MFRKYYLRCADSWMELSSRVQHRLQLYDADAIAENAGAMVGIFYNLPDMRHGLGRPASYEVRVVHDGPVHTRFVRFENGERAEIRYVTEQPAVLDTDYYYPVP